MSTGLAQAVVQEISLDEISPPLHDFREDKGDIDALAASITNEGLLQPILVRRNKESFELVAGSRRLSACRTLGWKKMPCLVSALSDQGAFEAALSENLVRKTLNPLEEANAFHAYIEGYGWGSERELARKIGRSPSYISKRLRLLTLPRDKLEELFRRRKNPSLIDELLSIDDSELGAYLLDLSLDSDITSKEIRRIGRRIARGESELGMWSGSAASPEEIRHKTIKRRIHKIYVALQVALHRMDDVLNDMNDDEWVLREIFLQQRVSLHRQIDLVVNLNKRIEKMPRPNSAVDR